MIPVGCTNWYLCDRECKVKRLKLTCNDATVRCLMALPLLINGRPYMKIRLILIIVKSNLKIMSKNKNYCVSNINDLIKLQFNYLFLYRYIDYKCLVILIIRIFFIFDKKSYWYLYFKHCFSTGLFLILLQISYVLWCYYYIIFY